MLPRFYFLAVAVVTELCDGLTAVGGKASVLKQLQHGK